MISKAKKAVLLSIATFAVAGLVVSCASLTDLATGSNVETGDAKVFRLSGLSVDPPQVAARDEVVITAEVTNISSNDAVYNAELKINDVAEAYDKVLVPAGKTQPLTFAVIKNEPGTYKVALDELASQFAVVESVAAVPVNQSATQPGQAGASCCSIGNQSTPQVSAQTGASCCGTGSQNNPYAQSVGRSGCGCRR